jgi:hypothetical protein
MNFIADTFGTCALWPDTFCPDMFCLPIPLVPHVLSPIRFVPVCVFYRYVVSFNTFFPLIDFAPSLFWPPRCFLLHYVLSAEIFCPLNHLSANTACPPILSSTDTFCPQIRCVGFICFFPPKVLSMSHLFKFTGHWFLFMPVLCMTPGEDKNTC